MEQLIRPPRFDVHPERIFLVGVSIRHTIDPTDVTLPTEAQLGEGEIGVMLTLARPSDRVLIVLLTLTLENSPWYEGDATYGGEFRMAENVPPEDMDETWRYVARQLAPITLYPFLRELLLNVTSRTMAPKIVLPFAPVPLETGEIEIPAADSEQRVLQFEGSGSFKQPSSELQSARARQRTAKARKKAE
jgi:hypothetical protein